MKLIRSWIIQSFGFSKSESNGIIVLMVIVMLMVLLSRVVSFRTHSTSSVLEDSLTLIKWAKEVNSSVSTNNKPIRINEMPEIRLRPFDPNDCNYEELLRLGFSSQTSGNIQAYLKAGGSFRIKSDLNRIYGISEGHLKEVWTYIQLPESIEKEQPTATLPERESSTEKPKEVIIDINSATAQHLEEIRGIGPVLSERIIKYRDLIGGFHSRDQLSEVYGIPPEVIVMLEGHLVVQGETRKININADSIHHITRHPYIDYRLGKAIFNYRLVHGPYTHIAELKQIKVVSDSLFNKISPYISIEPE